MGGAIFPGPGDFPAVRRTGENRGHHENRDNNSGPVD